MVQRSESVLIKSKDSTGFVVRVHPGALLPAWTETPGEQVPHPDRSQPFHTSSSSPSSLRLCSLCMRLAHFLCSLSPHDLLLLQLPLSCEAYAEVEPGPESGSPLQS